MSRIELVDYAQSHRRLLAVQIDAAINSGNSGGPVFKDGRLAGVAFQALDEAEQIGYMVATPVVEHFLQDVEDGNYDGFPNLGVSWQRLESQAHRQAIGLGDDWEGGVLVTRIIYGGSAWNVLREGDVLLEIDGVSIAADGTVPLRDGELVQFEHVVTRRYVGETLNVKVWRPEVSAGRGEQLSCMVPLRPPQYLVAEQSYDVRPSYYVVAGLVFVPLTRDYLRTWGESWWQTAAPELLALHEHGVRTAERHEPVVLQKVLADRVNQGYHDFESVLIEAIDGTPVRSLAHLVALVESSAGEYLRFRAVDGRRIVINREVAGDRHRTILERFGIPRDRSDDVRPAPDDSSHAA